MQIFLVLITFKYFENYFLMEYSLITLFIKHSLSYSTYLAVIITNLFYSYFWFIINSV